jgi:hypothetical protein
MDYFRRNLNNIVFIIALVLAIAGFTALVATALKADNFLYNFALNLLTEILGAVVTALIVGRVLRGAFDRALDERAEHILEEFNRSRGDALMITSDRRRTPEEDAKK